MPHPAQFWTWPVGVRREWRKDTYMDTCAEKLGWVEMSSDGDTPADGNSVYLLSMTEKGGMFMVYVYTYICTYTYTCVWDVCDMPYISELGWRGMVANLGRKDLGLAVLMSTIHTNSALHFTLNIYNLKITPKPLNLIIFACSKCLVYITCEKLNSFLCISHFFYTRQKDLKIGQKWSFFLKGKE